MHMNKKEQKIKKIEKLNRTVDIKSTTLTLIDPIGSNAKTRAGKKQDLLY